MSRPRKIIPDTVGINMVELASKILKMGDDATIGAWLRKAIVDCVNGCKDPDCDPFIKVQYENTVEEMTRRQDVNAQNYLRRLERQGKTLAESAICTTSEAAKALADDDTRKDSLNIDSGSNAETLPVRSAAEEKKPYGTCGHVMLTDTEGRHLRELYGNNLSTAIDILDAYIENGGKAAKKYRNHAAVLRKGNWVYEKVQTMALNEKRIENASKGPRNWKAEERERTARVLRGESADGKGYVRDDELTPAELEAKYG